jgi:hypothetical protein
MWVGLGKGGNFIGSGWFLEWFLRACPERFPGHASRRCEFHPG